MSLSDRSRRRLVNIAKALVSFGLIGVLLYRFDFSRSLKVAADANWHYLVAGLALAPLVIVCLALRFAAILDQGRLPLPRLTVLGLIWVGQFWNFFLPGSTGGDLYRLVQLWRHYPREKSRVVMAIFADRMLATLILLALVVVGALMLPYSRLPPVELPRWAPVVGYVAGLGALGGLVAALLLRVPLAAKLRALRGLMRQRLADARLFFVWDRALFRALAWALAGHLVNFLVFFCYCRAVGFTISFFQVVLILPPVLLLVMLPVSINGHGLREFLVIFFFGLLGIGTTGDVPARLPEVVLALSIVGLSSDFFWGLPGGVWFLLNREPTPVPPSEPARTTADGIS
jgi:uncharacterized membrane protein YbhN (UPF0104 family)